MYPVKKSSHKICSEKRYNCKPNSYNSVLSVTKINTIKFKNYRLKNKYTSYKTNNHTSYSFYKCPFLALHYSYNSFNNSLLNLIALQTSRIRCSSRFIYGTFNNSAISLVPKYILYLIASAYVIFFISNRSEL